MTGHLELELSTGTQVYVTDLMGVAYKNLSAHSDFSQMRPSRSGFDYKRGAFRSD